MCYDIITAMFILSSETSWMLQELITSWFREHVLFFSCKPRVQLGSQSPPARLFYGIIITGYCSR